MTRHETIEGINKRLEKMNKGSLERLLKFIDQRGDILSKSGLPYTGDAETDQILDDPELTKRLLEYQQKFSGLNARQTSKKLKDMETSGELISWEQAKAELGF